MDKREVFEWMKTNDPDMLAFISSMSAAFGDNNNGINKLPAIWIKVEDNKPYQEGEFPKAKDLVFKSQYQKWGNKSNQ